MFGRGEESRKEYENLIKKIDSELVKVPKRLAHITENQELLQKHFEQTVKDTQDYLKHLKELKEELTVKMNEKFSKDGESVE